MKRLLVLMFSLMILALAQSASAACAPAQTPVTTTGSVGEQSQNDKYISAIGPHPSNFHSLRVSFSIAGVKQHTKTIDFGANSGATILFGQQCEYEWWVGAPTGDDIACDTPDGWHSTGNSDRAFAVNLMCVGGCVTGSYRTLMFVNGLKVAELKNVGVLTSGTWNWNTTGLTKLESEGGTSSRLIWSGYQNGSLLTKQPKWYNDCGTLP